MSVTSIEDFLIRTCLDAETLRAARLDLAAALAGAGVPDAVAPLIASGRGPAISMAVRSTRPQPSAAAIEAYAAERAVVDPIFAMRLRDEPRPTLERAFLVKFPTTRTIESSDLDGRVVVRVHDRPGMGAPVPLEFTSDPADIEVDVEVVDVDTDIDIDVDDVIDIDTSDIDTDIDIDTDAVSGAPAASIRWATYWSHRREHWASLES